MEGQVELDVRLPSFEMLSFVRGLWPPGDDSREINLSFYVPDDSTVLISAQELVPVKYYQMRVIQERWQQGWNRFGPWETDVILAPLKVALSNVGVLARLGESDSLSREVAPLSLFGYEDPEFASVYQFYFRVKYDLKLASYLVIQVDTNEVISRDSLASVFGGSPALIQFDLSTADEGYYRLVVDCLYSGRPGGPQRTYKFYHKP